MTVDPARSARRQGMLLALTAAGAYGTNIVSAQIAGQAGLNGPLLVFYRVFVMLALVGAAVAIWRDVAGRAACRAAGAAAVRRHQRAGRLGLSVLGRLPARHGRRRGVLHLSRSHRPGRASSSRAMPFRPERLAAAFAAFVGVAMVVGPDMHGLDPRGLLLALVASLGAATQFFAGAALPRTALSARLFWSHLLILPVTALILAITGGFLPPRRLRAGADRRRGDDRRLSPRLPLPGDRADPHLARRRPASPSAPSRSAPC